MRGLFLLAVGCQTIDRDTMLDECGFDDAYTSIRAQRDLTLANQTRLTGWSMWLHDFGNPGLGAPRTSIGFWTCVPGESGRRSLLSSFSLTEDGEPTGVSAHRYIDAAADRLLEPVSEIQAELLNLSLDTERGTGGSLSSTLSVVSNDDRFDVDIDFRWSGIDCVDSPEHPDCFGFGIP